MAMAASLASSALLSPSAVAKIQPSQPLLRSNFHGVALKSSCPKSVSSRFSPLSIRATSSSEEPSSQSSAEVNDIVADLKEKWEALENKNAVLLYGGGAVVALWISTTIIGAVNSIPLLPKILELVGLGYTAWFVYRYLLFKSSRKELVEDIEELKKKIAGTNE